jgi:hypothetical protein
MAASSSSRIIPKLAIAASAAGGTIFACHHFESQRRILDAKSDDNDCTASSTAGALSSLQSKYKGFEVIAMISLLDDID